MSAIQLMRRAVKGVPAVIVSFNPMFAFCTAAGASNTAIRVNNDGTIDIQDNCGSFSFDQNFLSVGGFGGAADDFEVMLHVDAFSGPTAGLNEDQWYALTSNRQWNWTGFNEFNMGDWEITIRETLNVSNIDAEIFAWEVEDGS